MEKLSRDTKLRLLGVYNHKIYKVGDFGLSRIKRNALATGGVKGNSPEWHLNIDGLMCFHLAVLSRKSQLVKNLRQICVVGKSLEGLVRILSGLLYLNSVNPNGGSWWEQRWTTDPVSRPLFTEMKNRPRPMYKTLKQMRSTFCHIPIVRSVCRSWAHLFCHYISGSGGMFVIYCTTDYLVFVSLIRECLGKIISIA